MKKKISIPLEEQELHINYSPADMGRNCEVFTSIPWAMKYLERMVTNFPDDCKLIEDNAYSYTASIPFKLVKPRNPRAKMSEEQRTALTERLASARKKNA